jgi:hypothetical protein
MLERAYLVRRARGRVEAMRAILLLAIVAGCSRTDVPAPVPPGLQFEKHVLDTAFRSEGVAVFDVDQDGHMDLVTDQYWYAGPSFTPHEIRTPETYDPVAHYSHCVAAFGDDVDGDGFTDLVVAPFPTDAAYWYANPHPQAADVHWTPHLIAGALSATVESPVYVDLFGDGRRVLVMGQEPALVLGWLAPDVDPTAPWVMHPISPTGFVGAGHFVHGLGAGDVDGDGRLDVLTGYGWFQQTSDRASWPYHAAAFAPDDCDHMYTWDVDADGKNDVLCSSPHGYGVWWWQQGAPAAPGGEPTFVQRLIDDTLSQTHAMRLDDLDGDGVPEIVTGKRWYAHGPTGDPGSGDPALLVYYSRTLDATSAPRFVRHVVDDDSGVGTMFSIGDVDGDRKPDLAVSNKKGLFFFRQL